MKNNKFIKFILVGILNTAFGYSLFALFIFLNMHYSLAVFLSTALGILFNFKTIGKLVFDSHDNSLIFRFIFVYVLLYLINISCLWFFKISGWENMYINGFILLIPLALISFVLNKKFVFKGKK
ncbi:GtrA family protein [Aliarcobacter butzleri]|uniref:GtrA family protein n=1 Tax=Aliarcobacter butzleri TaxID=28197 RepID=UPI0021B3349F|nr:GtrA family protein [Aliarcobacter butzleri]MCT7554551.1 GtrA family protein [Aliarcobacter butzleri]